MYFKAQVVFMLGSKSCTTMLDRTDTEKQLVWKSNSKATLRESQRFGKPEQQKLIKETENTQRIKPKS